MANAIFGSPTHRPFQDKEIAFDNEKRDIEN
jgi:hypothetical protein